MAQPISSPAGITRFTAGTVNFGATDVPASSTDLAAARGGPAVQVPVDLGGISVAYNVMTLNGSLKLTGPVLARDVVSGHIDDLAIVQYARLGEVAHEAAEFREGNLAPRDADNDPVGVVDLQVNRH